MDDLDKSKETAEQKAKRQWSNHDLRRRFLEDKKAYKATQATGEPKLEIGDIIETERRKPDSTTKFERQFIKDLRAMLDGHKKENLKSYKLVLKSMKHRLLKEKLKRLLAKQALRDQEAAIKVALQPPKPKKDLFA